MSSHSESSGNEPVEADEKTYQLGLFSSRLKGYVAVYVGMVKAKTELQLVTYYPRLKGYFPGDPELADILTLKKMDDSGEKSLKEINLSEVEISELKVVKPNKASPSSGPKRSKADDDYHEETGLEILAQLPEDIEISLEYSTSLELIFVRTGQAVRLHALIINNTEILN